MRRPSCASKASIPGLPLDYLRFVRCEGNAGKGGWRLAAGAFDDWPEHLGKLKVLDPCCGSGHFLVAAFLMLVPMRMEREGLDARAAVDAVLRENLHGLELDPRCVQLAAFALALTAWMHIRRGSVPAAAGTEPRLFGDCAQLNQGRMGRAVRTGRRRWRVAARIATCSASMTTCSPRSFEPAWRRFTISLRRRRYSVR